MHIAVYKKKYELFIVLCFLILGSITLFKNAYSEDTNSYVTIVDALCDDGLDNDGDTLIDYPADPGCDSILDNDETDPIVPACNDGIDNDGDSLIDYPNDPGCENASDTDETNPITPPVFTSDACNDGIDNDGDGLIDYPADPGCTSLTDTNETDPSGGGGILFIDTTGPIIQITNTSIQDISAQIDWSAIDQNGPVSCSFSYGITANYGQIGSVTNNFSTTITNLTPNTTYYYEITCIDNSPSKNISFYTATFTTLDVIPLDDQVTISDISIIANTNQSEISWQTDHIDTIEQCIVTHDITDSFSYPFIIVTSQHTNGYFHVTLTNLIPQTQYYFIIQCQTSDNLQGSTQNTYITLPDDIPPPDVLNFRATGGELLINLDWDYTPTLNDFSRYVIRKSTTAFPNTLSEGTLLTSISDIQTHTFVDTDVTPLQIYYYTIFVIDTSQNNSNGLSASATPYGPEISVQFNVIGHAEKRSRINVSTGEQLTTPNLTLDSYLILEQSSLAQTILTTPIPLNALGIGSSEQVTIPSGTYDILLKGNSHLTRRIKGMPLTTDNGTYNLDFTFANTTELLAGDVQGNGLKDNIVNSLDISATILELYTSTKNADLNYDGVVNGLDLSILLVNLYKRGN